MRPHRRPMYESRRRQGRRKEGGTMGNNKGRFSVNLNCGQDAQRRPLPRRRRVVIQALRRLTVRAGPGFSPRKSIPPRSPSLSYPSKSPASPDLSAPPSRPERWRRSHPCPASSSAACPFESAPLQPIIHAVENVPQCPFALRPARRIMLPRPQRIRHLGRRQIVYRRSDFNSGSACVYGSTMARMSVFGGEDRSIFCKRENSDRIDRMPNVKVVIGQSNSDG